MNRYLQIEQVYSDADLLAAIRNKDALDSAVRYLYRHYADTIRSFILANSGSPEDAEDVFQETVVTFIETVRKDRFRGESAIKTFLVAIARNIWLNELKKKERAGLRNAVFENSRIQPEPDISELISQREIKSQFREVLGKLGENCARILTLFYYENLSMKEIVKHLPYENEQVVRNKKYKCLQQLAGLLRSNPLVASLFEKKP